ncbi:hypothetical protein [Streptomyces sp. NPDC002922]|uniref:hypothetical protein n=1 Tax=Streptomyces sp. NPDC002922 TaxID=3154439 RepID=UPI0033A7F116
MRPSPRRWSVFAVAGAALLSLAQPAALSAAHAAAAATTDSAAPTAPAAQRNVPPGTHSVTLITGDVVVTRQSGAAGGTVDVRSATGAPADAHIMESNGDLMCIPAPFSPMWRRARWTSACSTSAGPWRAATTTHIATSCR